MRVTRRTPTPYVPSWCFPNNEPRICLCGDHEGYHDDTGVCINRTVCGCPGMPTDEMTPLLSRTD